MIRPRADPENDLKELAQTWPSKGRALNKTGKQKEARASLQRSLELFNKTSP
jgi:predicted RNA polymerase sigma factor